MEIYKKNKKIFKGRIMENIRGDRKRVRDSIKKDEHVDVEWIFEQYKKQNGICANPRCNYKLNNIFEEEEIIDCWRITSVNRINNNLFIKDTGKNRKIKPIKVQHGNVHSICYIIDKKLAYISDVSKIFNKDYKYFRNLQYLIIDCLWYRDHPSHFNLEKSLDMIKIFSPKKAILTNLHTDIDYVKIKKLLPKNIIPAHDGLTINL